MASLWNTCIGFTMIIWYFWLISKGLKLSFAAWTPRWVETQWCSSPPELPAVTWETGHQSQQGSQCLPISCRDLLFGGRRWWVIPGRCPRLSRDRLWISTKERGRGGRCGVGMSKSQTSFKLLFSWPALPHFPEDKGTQCPVSGNYMEGVSWDLRQPHLIFAEPFSATRPFSERLFPDHQAPQFLHTSVLTEHSDRAMAPA